MREIIKTGEELCHDAKGIGNLRLFTLANLYEFLCISYCDHLRLYEIEGFGHLYLYIKARDFDKAKELMDLIPINIYVEIHEEYDGIMYHVSRLWWKVKLWWFKKRYKKFTGIGWKGF